MVLADVGQRDGGAETEGGAAGSGELGDGRESVCVWEGGWKGEGAGAVVAFGWRDAGWGETRRSRAGRWGSA